MGDPDNGSSEADEYKEIRHRYAEQLSKRVDAGETLSSDELIFFDKYDPLKDPEDLPSSLHVGRVKVPRSPAQQAQALKNIKRINEEGLQTGPTTPAGKASSSRNATKYGLYAQRFMNIIKPCLSTCPEYPCPLVDSGGTTPGSYCMEKHSFIESLQAIELAILSGKRDSFNELLAIELASNLEVIRALREHVIQSPIVKSIKRSKTTMKDTEVIEHEQIEYKPNPAALALTQLLRDMGLNFKEANITPRQVAQTNTDDEAAKALAAIAGKSLNKLKGAAKETEE